MLIVAGGLIGGAYYIGMSHSIKPVPQNSVVTPTPQPTSQPKPSMIVESSNNSIKDYITFAKPTNWTEKIDVRPNFMIFTSSDLAITIQRREDDPKLAIDQVLHPLHPEESLDSDVKLTKVSSLEAISFHYNFEGHAYTFVIAQPPKYVWQIDITSKNLATENSHRTEIDSFINSIVIR